jgi:hypothetical protein
VKLWRRQGVNGPFGSPVGVKMGVKRPVRALPKGVATAENLAISRVFAGAPEGIRTPNPRIRSPMLCPVELRARLMQTKHLPAVMSIR